MTMTKNNPTINLVKESFSKVIFSAILMLVGMSTVCSSAGGNDEEYPGIDEFIPLEKEPAVIDMDELKAAIFFPNEYFENEDKIYNFTVGVLVDTDSTAVEVKVLDADKKSLKQNVIDGLTGYSGFTPGMLEGKPVPAWIIFPIEYNYSNYLESRGYRVYSTVVEVLVLGNGQVKEARLKKSSGKPDVDSSAIQSALQYEGYTAPRGLSDDEEFILVLPITFNKLPGDGTFYPERKSVKKSKYPLVNDFIPVESVPEISDLQDLMKQVKYPKDEKKKGNEGLTKVQILIGTDGIPIKYRILASSGHIALDLEAGRAAMEYKDYTPAVQDGKPVPCWMVLPINFQLK